MILNNALNYRGETKNGIPHGKGVLITTSELLFEGEFENGMAVKGKVTHPSGGTYTGELRNGRPNGMGTR